MVYAKAAGLAGVHPAQVEEIVFPPVSALWADKVPVFRSLLGWEAAEWSTVIDALA